MNPLATLLGILPEELQGVIDALRNSRTPSLDLYTPSGVVHLLMREEVSQ